MKERFERYGNRGISMINRNFVFTPVTMHGVQVGMAKDREQIGSKMKVSGGDKDRLKFVPGLPEGLSSAGHSLRRRSKFVPGWSLNNTDPTLKYTPSIEGMYGTKGERDQAGRGKIESEGREYTLDWWTQTAIFRYNALMVSAAYGLDRWDFREFYDIPRRDFIFITDSGGYQIFSQGLKMEAVDILRWMEHNADIGLTLDRPPMKTGEKILGSDEIPRATKEDFKISIEKSKENYEIMHRNRQANDLVLLKVIHGFSLNELNRFYEAVKDFEFDGHAFGANQNDVRSVALVLGFAQTIEKERVHMFLITGAFTAPVVIYAKRFFKHLTFDSSSFSVTGARYRKYYYPNKISAGISFGKKYNASLKELPCTCPVCQLATVADLNAEGSVPGGLIALHNLYQVLQYFSILEKLADSPDNYIEYLRHTGCPHKTIEMIEYLRCIEENDFDTANKKYKMEIVGKPTLEQAFG